MAKNTGMTNSARFYNSRTNEFDIEKCFNENNNAIKGSLKELKYIKDNPDYFTDADLHFHAELLANEFYTTIKVALEWEKKQLKK
jgi:hypothetical protein